MPFVGRDLHVIYPFTELQEMRKEEVEIFVRLTEAQAFLFSLSLRQFLCLCAFTNNNNLSCSQIHSFTHSLDRAIISRVFF